MKDRSFDFRIPFALGSAFVELPALLWMVRGKPAKYKAAAAAAAILPELSTFLASDKDLKFAYLMSTPMSILAATTLARKQPISAMVLSSLPAIVWSAKRLLDKRRKN